MPYKVSLVMPNLFRHLVRLSPAIFFLCLALFSCSSKSKVELHEQKSREAGRAAEFSALETERQKSRALDSYLNSLSLRERLAQLFVLNLEGNEKFWFVEWVDGEKGPQAKKEPLIPGGYIFFSFNISKDPKQIAAFTDSVRDFARERQALEPFLCLDAEGGYVNRLRGVASPLPENEWISNNLSPKEAALIYALNAVQLRALGFDLNLSPVVEVQNERNQKFLDGRSFGGAEKVLQYGSEAVLAYQTNKVGTVLKHFPGNGEVDPHAALPLLSYETGEFSRDVLAPFAALCALKPSGVLMSHALVNVFQAHSEDGLQGQNGDGLQDQNGDGLQDQNAAAASKTPASLSAYWIKNVLRGALGFRGLVFSDDIFMAALEKNGWTGERAVRAAVLAGANCILMSEKRFINEWKIAKKLYEADADFRAAADDSAKRVLKFKLDAGILEYDFSEKKIVPAKRRPSLQEGLDSRLNRFYGAKKLGEEALKKYGED